MKSKKIKRGGCNLSSFLHHPALHSMAPRQNPRDNVLATPSSTPASFFSSQRPPAGGKDCKLICDLEICYRQLKAVKDNIVKASDGHSAKEYFGKLGTFPVIVLLFVTIFF